VAFTSLFREQKKEINKVFAPDRKRGGGLYDRVPNKYFQYHLRADPLHRSFIIEKFVNAFAKHGEKKRIRALFYRLFREEGIDASPDSLLFVVKSLMPKYLNVVARRGRIVYRAPIEASRPKSVMKAIKFFKFAALSRQTDLTIYEKIRGEFLDFMY
jgi:ribosomal protein S7